MVHRFTFAFLITVTAAVLAIWVAFQAGDHPPPSVERVFAALLTVFMAGAMALITFGNNKTPPHVDG